MVLKSLISAPHLIQAAVELREILSIHPQNPGNLSETLHSIASAALNIAESDYCAISIINPIRQKFLETRILTSDMPQDVPLLREPLHLDRITQDLIHQQRVLLRLKDLDINSEYEDPFPQYGPTKSLIVLKLLTPRKRDQIPLALLYLGYKEHHQFTSLDERFLSLLADQASSALQHTWSLRRYDEVARIGKEINEELVSVETIFDKLMLHAPGILDTSYLLMLGVCDLPLNKLDVYLMEKTNKYKVLRRQTVKGASGWVIKEGQPLSIKNYEEEKANLVAKGVKIMHLPKTEKIIPASMIFEPLNIRGTTLGVLSIQQNRPDAFDHEDRQIFRLLAHHVALAVSNLRLKKGLEQLHEVGQGLTQKLNSKDVIQEVIDAIRQATDADVVSLHPYDESLGMFIPPVVYSGKLLQPELFTNSYVLGDDMARLSLNYKEPYFATDSSQLYEALGGDKNARRGNFEVRERIQSTAVLPLQVGGQAVGVLFINFRHKHHFTEIQKQYMSGLANYTAIAIRNYRAFADIAQRRIQELESLRQIDQVISQTLELEPLLRVILEHAAERLKDTSSTLNGTILLYDEQTNSLKVRVAIGPNEKLRIGQSVPLGENKGITSWVMENKRPKFVGDVLNDPEWKDVYLKVDEQTRSEIDVPLLDENEQEVLGVISFESSRKDRFTEDRDEVFLMTLAKQAVVAIKKAQAYERETLALRAQRAMQEIGREIVSRLDFNNVANAILINALELTKAGAGAVFLYDDRREDLYMAASRNVSAVKHWARLPPNKGLIGHVMNSRELLTINIQNAGLQEDSEPWLAESKWALAVPMIKSKDGLPLGVIRIESVHPFSPYNEQLLGELADLAVIALDNARSYKLVEDALQRMKSLYAVGNKLGEITDLDQLEEAYGIVGREMQFEDSVQVVIRRYESENRTLKVRWKAQRQHSELFDEISIDDESINSLVFKQGEPKVIPDTAFPPLDTNPHLSDPSTRSLVVVPIKFRERKYGNLALSHQRTNYFAAVDLELIKGLAQLLGLTIYRLEAEKQNRELEIIGSIGQISFELAHRIGNDLGWIETHIDEKITEADARKELDQVIEKIKEVLNLSWDIQQEFISYKDTGKDTITIEALLKAAEEIFPPIPSKVDITWDVTDKQVSLHIVQSHITRCLHNLISNAIDAMPEGGHITISTLGSGSFVEIKVTDTGHGIEPEFIPQIFDLFVSTKGSSGFGLWSAKRYAVANGGELTVDSVVGKGTTFSLRLPRISNGNDAPEILSKQENLGYR